MVRAQTIQLSLLDGSPRSGVGLHPAFVYNRIENRYNYY